MAEAAYRTGRADVPRDGVELVTKAQEEAYQAGRMDRITKAGEKAEKPARGRKRLPARRRVIGRLKMSLALLVVVKATANFSSGDTFRLNTKHSP